jgi:hypothetical protein
MEEADLRIPHVERGHRNCSRVARTVGAFKKRQDNEPLDDVGKQRTTGGRLGTDFVDGAPAIARVKDLADERIPCRGNSCRVVAHEHRGSAPVGYEVRRPPEADAAAPHRSCQELMTIDGKQKVVNC